ncbi:MAG: radical SAM protein [Nitrospirae bacterium]|nr:radical SAM protein [Nitrospirota bacterium]
MHGTRKQRKGITHILFPLFGNRVPGQLIIQYTDKCNARCPQCGMRVTEHFSRSKLDIETVKRMIDHAAENGVNALSFTGGEPFLFFDDIMELVTYAGDAGIKYTRTGTNGFMFMNPSTPDFNSRIRRIAEGIAASGLYTFWISIDSAVPALHEQMRGLPGVIEGIEKALPIFGEYGIYPSANLGINRNTGGVFEAGTSSAQIYDSFRKAFGKFYSAAIDLGFTIVNACYPMSIDADDPGELSAVYGATSEASLIQFTKEERAVVFSALFDTIPEYRSKIRIFTPRTSLHSLIRQYTLEPGYSYSCRGGIEFFFVNAGDGNTYPCGYRGTDNLGKFWELDFEKLDKKAQCRRCDWECFRDPSELSGPLLTLFGNPAFFLKRVLKDPPHIKLWLEDIRYFAACNLFDGRTPPDYRKLSAFAPE